MSALSYYRLTGTALPLGSPPLLQCYVQVMVNKKYYLHGLGAVYVHVVQARLAPNNQCAYIEFNSLCFNCY